MRHIVDNRLELDANSVWVLPGNPGISYSDGRITEGYIARTVEKAGDLGSDSFELENRIIDWPTAYHMSRKRSLLLKGFDLDPEKEVLEVGCGCGAITRFLGESFSQVTAVEGSYGRARIARMRTRGMDNVSVIGAPFADISFGRKFDIVICIGVLEYAGSFSGSEDPYDDMLARLAGLVTGDGVLVIAIENRFGLKYFSSAPEDHTNIMYEGIEGYPRSGRSVRTFGYHELKRRVKKHFDGADFYFPFPDYKMPSCVVSEELFSKVPSAELVGRFMSEDRLTRREPPFDEKKVLCEMEKRGTLHVFANSFLVLAKKGRGAGIGMGCLGTMFSAKRKIRFDSVTRVCDPGGGDIIVDKRPSAGDTVREGKLTMRSVASPWIKTRSLQARAEDKARTEDASLKEIVSEGKEWFGTIKALGDAGTIGGEYLDIIWRNSFTVGRECVFIDQEWVWEDALAVKFVIIRGLFYLFRDMKDIKARAVCLKGRTLMSLIVSSAAYFGHKVTFGDLAGFIRIESSVQSVSTGMSVLRARTGLVYLLLSGVGLSHAEKLLRMKNVMMKDARRRIKSVIRRLRVADRKPPASGGRAPSRS